MISCVGCLVAFSCGVAASDLVDLFLIEHVLPMRRPVQDWMTRIGLGRVAPYYAFINLNMPHIPLSMLAGAVCGVVVPRSWLLLVLCYASGVIALRFNWHFSWYALICVVPFAASMAWISSRWTNRQRLSQENLCVQCGYDLRGSAETCPECGHAMESGVR